MELINSLSLFNRKERYWLIRNTLGKENTQIPLSKEFRERLGSTVQLEIPEYAWWAIDYHVDWLIGALVHYANAGAVIDQHYDNPITDYNTQERLVRGSQEDFDFIIAFKKTIILVEAKFSTGWSREQLTSKVQRLHALSQVNLPHGFFEDTGATPGVAIHMVLMSPKKMGKQNLPPLDKPIRNGNGEPHQILMKSDAGIGEFRAVQRYNSVTQKPDKNGGEWRLVSEKVPGPR